MATMILAHADLKGVAGYAQTISTSSHEITADEPVRRGGTDRGPAPFELMLSGLGACTAITLRMYADRKQWKLGEIGVKLRLLKDDDQPLRIERIISVSEPLDTEQWAKVLEIADKTPVTRILASGVSIHTTLTSPS